MQTVPFLALAKSSFNRQDLSVCTTMVYIQALKHVLFTFKWIKLSAICVQTDLAHTSVDTPGCCGRSCYGVDKCAHDALLTSLEEILLWLSRIKSC